ncbi:1075_t:CDS:2 [Diversispora eburnea]|uniref:1075_t:CDS:1 n=1 Tax=Diversispora eburnea TaxID=1213867 RepID=A0A9N8ZZT7_9GLOM|nr:1075_t:CDS:2 [Diversispora eburnea]
MHSIFFTLVILALIALTTAFPNGSGTCNSNQTVIEGVQGQPMGTLKELGYEFAITMEKNQYKPGGPPVKFCVHGKFPYKGVLLYALDKDKNHVGSWKVQPGHKILNLNCLGDKEGTLTHSDPSPKGPNLCYLYSPPLKDVGAINFVGTVCQSRDAGFQIVRFPTFFTAEGGNNNNVTTTTMTKTTCTYEETKPTYEKPTYEKPPYEKTTYEKPPYEKTTYEKPPYEKTTYEKPPYEKPTNENTKMTTTCDYTKPTHENTKPSYEKPTYEKPTYENTKPTYEKPTYENTKPTYEKPTYEKPTYENTKPTYEKPTYEVPTYEPTKSNSPVGFNPPEVNAANGITYTGCILLLQLMIVYEYMAGYTGQRKLENEKKNEEIEENVENDVNKQIDWFTLYSLTKWKRKNTNKSRL